MYNPPQNCSFFSGKRVVEIRMKYSNVSLLSMIAFSCAIISMPIFADDKQSSPEAPVVDKPGTEKPKAPKAESKTEPSVRADWARIVLSGAYPETHQLPGLFGELTEGLDTCLDRLNQAAREKAIKGVLLEIRTVSIGWAKLHEIQVAIREIRAAGKPVWAQMTDVTTKEYLLATACDRILVPEPATLMLTGLRAEVTFYRNLLEKLDVKADMLRVGAFKSAAEPYTRTEMSDEFRIEMEELLDDYYSSIVSQISAARHLTEDQVRAVIDEGMLPAGRAKELGLIDDLVYDDQIVGLIQNGDSSLDVRFREDYKKKKASTELDFFALMELIGGGAKQKSSIRPRIAVLHAEGAIVSGNIPAGLMGGSGISSDRMVPLIQKLGKDENVKAIVLRVDSPGGSALASDLIWRALEATGKPLVASMGDTAASGGYYISMGADRIFAEPGTITGSIGVVGGKVSFEGLMKKAGVTMSVVQRGKNAGVMSLTGAFSESEREVVQRMLDTIYRQFTEKAAAGRKMDYAALEALARGRIYTGRRAKELGLVDEIGTLADAIKFARGLAGDSEHKLELETLPKPQSPLEMLLSQTGSQPNTPAAMLLDVLPEEFHPAVRHLTALQQLLNEPALVMMPFTLRIE
jgi:protease-4